MEGFDTLFDAHFDDKIHDNNNDGADGGAHDTGFPFDASFGHDHPTLWFGNDERTGADVSSGPADNDNATLPDFDGASASLDSAMNVQALGVDFTLMGDSLPGAIGSVPDLFTPYVSLPPYAKLSSFEKLPSHILKKIFDYLSYQSLGRMFGVKPQIFTEPCFDSTATNPIDRPQEDEDLSSLLPRSEPSVVVLDDETPNATAAAEPMMSTAPTEPQATSTPMWVHADEPGFTMFPGFPRRSPKPTSPHPNAPVESTEDMIAPVPARKDRPKTPTTQISNRIETPSAPRKRKHEGTSTSISPTPSTQAAHQRVQFITSDAMAGSPRKRVKMSPQLSRIDSMRFPSKGYASASSTSPVSASPASASPAQLQSQLQAPIDMRQPQYPPPRAPTAPMMIPPQANIRHNQAQMQHPQPQQIARPELHVNTQSPMPMLMPMPRMAQSPMPAGHQAQSFASRPQSRASMQSPSAMSPQSTVNMRNVMLTNPPTPSPMGPNFSPNLHQGQQMPQGTLVYNPYQQMNMNMNMQMQVPQLPQGYPVMLPGPDQQMGPNFVQSQQMANAYGVRTPQPNPAFQQRATSNPAQQVRRAQPQPARGAQRQPSRGGTPQSARGAPQQAQGRQSNGKGDKKWNYDPAAYRQKCVMDKQHLMRQAQQQAMFEARHRAMMQNAGGSGVPMVTGFPGMPTPAHGGVNGQMGMPSQQMGMGMGMGMMPNQQMGPMAPMWTKNGQQPQGMQMRPPSRMQGVPQGMQIDPQLGMQNVPHPGMSLTPQPGMQNIQQPGMQNVQQPNMPNTPQGAVPQQQAMSPQPPQQAIMYQPQQQGMGDWSPQQAIFEW